MDGRKPPSRPLKGHAEMFGLTKNHTLPYCFIGTRHKVAPLLYRYLTAFSLFPWYKRTIPATFFYREAIHQGYTCHAFVHAVGNKYFSAAQSTSLKTFKQPGVLSPTGIAPSSRSKKNTSACFGDLEYPMSSRICFLPIRSLWPADGIKHAREYLLNGSATGHLQQQYHQAEIDITRKFTSRFKG